MALFCFDHVCGLGFMIVCGAFVINRQVFSDCCFVVGQLCMGSFSMLIIVRLHTRRGGGGGPLQCRCKITHSWSDKGIIVHRIL